MSGTKIRERVKDYNRIIKEDAEAAKKGSYGVVLEKLKSLVELSERFYYPDDAGHYPSMDKTSFQELINAYQEVDQACYYYNSNQPNLTKFEKKRLNIVKNLSNYVYMDLNFLSNLDLTEMTSLPDAIREARSRKIRVSGKKLGKVGAQQNVRIPIKTTKGVKGFFTESKMDKRSDDWESFISKNKSWFPKKYQRRFLQYRKDTKVMDQFLSMFPNKSEMKQEENDKYLDDLQQLFFPEADAIADETQRMNEKIRLQRGLAEMLNNSDFLQKHYPQFVAGIRDRGRVDQRNSAMYTVANELGSGKLIARAVPMTVTISGEEREGTFMENAEGYDIREGKAKLGDKELSYGQDVFFNEKSLRQMADLQIIDFICGNTDRHMANVIYQFQEDKNGKASLVKITGIDNDCSFGVENEIKYQKGRLANVNSLCIISEEQAVRLQNMDPDRFKLALAPYALSKEGLDGVVARVKQLKEAIGKTVTVVKNDEWKEYVKKEKLDELCANKHGYNIFMAMNAVPGMLKKDKEKLEEKQKENEPIEQEKNPEFSSGRDLSEGYYIDLKQNQERILRLAKKMHEENKNLYINSRKFKAMKNAVYALEEFSNELKKTYKGSEDRLNEIERDKLAKLYQTLQQTSQEYIDAKKIAPKSDHGQRRLELARNLRDLALDVCNEMIPEEKVNENGGEEITM